MQMIIFLVMMSLKAEAYIPTAESLLRNGANKDVASNTVLLNAIITDITDGEGGYFGDSENNTKRDRAFKIVLNNLSDGNPRILQVEYADTDFSYGSIFKLRYTTLSLDRIGGNKENIDRRFLYGLFSLFLNNDPKLLLDVAENYGSDLKRNKDLLNREKLDLLAKYRFYLSKAENDSVNLENPLTPTDEAKKEAVKKIMSQSLYRDLGNIARIKDGSRFFFEIRDPVLNAKIDQSNRQIRNITMKTSYGEVSAVMRDYVIMNNGYEMPEYFIMKLSNGRKYKVRPTKLSVYPDSATHFDNLYNKYKKHGEQNTFVTAPKPLEILSI